MEIAELLQTKGRTIQLDIIKRFMNETQFEEFVKQYKSSRFSFRSANRQDNLARPLTDEEKKVLRVYLRDMDTPVSVLERELQLKPGTMYHMVTVAALRFLFQNQEKFKI